MLAREADPRALYKLVAACGGFRHPALRLALKGLWDARGARLEVSCLVAGVCVGVEPLDDGSANRLHRSTNQFPSQNNN